MGRILEKPDSDEPMPRYTTILRHFAIVVNGDPNETPSSDAQGDGNAAVSTPPGPNFTAARQNGSVSLFCDGELIAPSKNVSIPAICAAANSAFHSMIVNPQDTKHQDTKEAGEWPKSPRDVFVLGARDESHPPDSSVSPDAPMELQQFRVYPRALAAADIKRIHDNSRDRDGVLLMQCSRLEDPTEKDSLDWKDEFGHNCAWYAARRTSSRFICSGEDVRKFCKVACSQQRCFSPNYRVAGYVLGRQVQMFTESTTLCVSSKVSDKHGLPLMNGTMLNESVCNGTSAGSDPSADMDSKALQNSSAAIGVLDPERSVPTLTSWSISPEAGGNVTLVFTMMDADVRKEVVTVRPLRSLHSHCSLYQLKDFMDAETSRTLQVYDKHTIPGTKPLGSFRAGAIGVSGVRQAEAEACAARRRSGRYALAWHARSPNVSVVHWRVRRKH
jgi:hypothetical protein